MARVTGSTQYKLPSKRRGGTNKVLTHRSVVEFELEGIDELIAILEGLGDRASGVLFEAVMDGAEIIRDEAIRLGPGPHIITWPGPIRPGSVAVDVGPDKDHWFYQFSETGAGAHEITPDDAQILTTAKGSTGDPIFGNLRNPVEHPGMVAQPFLRPAVDRKGAAAVDAIGERIRRAIEPSG